MNDGIHWEADYEFDDAWDYSRAWWVESRKMVNRGWKHFCKKRPNIELNNTMRDDINASARHGHARRDYIDREEGEWRSGREWDG